MTRTYIHGPREISTGISQYSSGPGPRWCLDWFICKLQVYSIVERIFSIVDVSVILLKVKKISINYFVTVRFPVPSA